MVQNSKVSFDPVAFFREAKFLVNVAQLANEGIIISWGERSERPVWKTDPMIQQSGIGWPETV